MKTIELHGDLGERFGRTFNLEVISAGEAINALSANFPAFREHLMTSDRQGIGYHVLVDDDVVGPDHLMYPAHGRITFVPAIVGAGSGDSKIILGSALIAVGVGISAFSGGGLSGIGLTAVKIGAALTVTGVIQSLTPVPRASAPAEKPENDPSYNFNGPVNTTAQGQPVPIGYGKLIIGSSVISAGISVDELISPQQIYDEKIRATYEYYGRELRI